MKTQAICAGLTLLVFVLVESKSAVRPPGSCQYELMKRCNHQFKDIFEFEAALGNKSDAVYCQGLQVSFMISLKKEYRPILYGQIGTRSRSAVKIDPKAGKTSFGQRSRAVKATFSGQNYNTDQDRPLSR